MKKIFILLSILPWLVSCDNIDEQDRYIDTGPVEVARKVLLEEFTGQLCTNCPQAHKIIESLEEQYGDDLIVVSIHAGKGSFGIAAPYGLMQEEGQEYADRWGVVSYPAGVIDRNSGVLTMDQWAADVRKDLEKPTDLQLTLEAQLNEEGNKIEVFTTMVSPASLDGSLQLWVVESGIEAMQLDGSQYRMDYIHNNVFRACVNGLWGEETPLDRGVVKYTSNTIAVDEAWNLKNISIVGFYYTAGGVVQVEKCGLKTTAATE